MRALLFAALAFAVATPALAQPAHTGCNLVSLSRTQALWYNNTPFVHASINGKPAYAGVLTSFIPSGVLDRGAEHFGLTPIPGSERRAPGFDGQMARTYGTRVADMRIGDMQLSNAELTVFSSPVRVPHDEQFLTLGSEYLSQFAVELNPADNQVAFHRAVGECGSAHLAHWSADAQSVSFTPNSPLIVFEVELNGFRLQALLDTGSPVSLLEAGAARRTGVERQEDTNAPSVVGMLPTAGVGRFETFQIGGETIRNARLRLIDYPILGGFGPLADIDMIIGADFARAHRMLIAYAQNKLYFTYTGGPVFDRVLPPSAEFTVSARSGSAN